MRACYRHFVTCAVVRSSVPNPLLRKSFEVLVGYEAMLRLHDYTPARPHDCTNSRSKGRTAAEFLQVEIYGLSEGIEHLLGTVSEIAVNLLVALLNPGK